MASTPSGTRSVKDTIDLLLPLFLTGLLVALCCQLLLPFVGLLLWTIILAICFNPLQEKLLAKGWKPGRAAMLGGVIVARSDPHDHCRRQRGKWHSAHLSRRFRTDPLSPAATAVG
jgi:hypothetical protein